MQERRQAPWAVLMRQLFLDSRQPGRLFDAMMVGIAHPPEVLPEASRDRFHLPAGLMAVGRRLKPDGAFGLGSSGPADARLWGRLALAFPQAWAEPVTFHNPLTDHLFTQTDCLARDRGGAAA